LVKPSLNDEFDDFAMLLVKNRDKLSDSVWLTKLISDKVAHLEAKIRYFTDNGIHVERQFFRKMATYKDLVERMRPATMEGELCTKDLKELASQHAL
jgi:hypothetical protein